jgi:hypothetical protein
MLNLSWAAGRRPPEPAGGSSAGNRCSVQEGGLLERRNSFEESGVPAGTRALGGMWSPWGSGALVRMGEVAARSPPGPPPGAASRESRSGSMVIPLRSGLGTAHEARVQSKVTASRRSGESERGSFGADVARRGRKCWMRMRLHRTRGPRRDQSDHLNPNEAPPQTDEVYSVSSDRTTGEEWLRPSRSRAA